jgi:uncharacterized protein YjbI with pentapeptide repeats
MRVLKFAIFVFVFLLSFSAIIAQVDPRTVYPYGGIPDSSRAFLEHRGGDMIIPYTYESYDMESAQFEHRADFDHAKFYHIDLRNATFNGKVNFDDAHIERCAHFSNAHFNGQTLFTGIRFDESAEFVEVVFDTVTFASAQFDGNIIFSESVFNNLADFRSAKFDSVLDFSRAVFRERANFSKTKFRDVVNFRHTKFDSQVSFEEAIFSSPVDFSYSTFTGPVNFSEVTSQGTLQFRGTQFNNIVDFRDATLDSLIFDRAVIVDKFKLGSVSGQEFDFRRAILASNAKLELHELVELNMQTEKVRYITLLDSIGYFLKKDIVENLKNRSFKEDKQARFELDYLFARSTIYQKESGNFERFSAFQPTYWIQFLYNATMGLGYRPFRLLWWIVIIIAGYSIFYVIAVPHEINQYISGNREQEKNSDEVSNDIKLTNTIINCLYFSSMVFFTFRLRRDILISFDVSKTRIVVSEWVLGFLIYISFLSFSKSGSILHTLKSLFVG